MQSYFDCFSGVAGDMLVGALLDAGAPFEVLKQCIDSMQFDVAIRSERRLVQGINSTKFIVEPGQVQPVRHLSAILEIIDQALAPDAVKAKAKEIFEHLAGAEAGVHGVPAGQIHFHEIGAVDTIVDILGTLICLHELKITSSHSSPLPWNTGYVTISHGKYPLPAPAAAILLKNVPVFGSSCDQELVTPTGAAILTGICASFGPLPSSTPCAIGYGAGTLIRSDGVPNLLRVIISDDSALAKPPAESVGVIETQIDDMNPEFFTHLYDLIQKESSILDLFTTPVYMKKNRPGVLISVIVRPQDIERVAALILSHTTSLGVRTRIDTRYFLKRSQFSVDTPWGPVRVKSAHLPDGRLRNKPEFEDCRNIAVKQDISLSEVYDFVNKKI